MISIAFATVFCCIVPALSVTVGGVIEVARSHSLSREITQAFASLPAAPRA